MVVRGWRWTGNQRELTDATKPHTTTRSPFLAYCKGAASSCAPHQRGFRASNLRCGGGGGGVAVLGTVAKLGSRTMQPGGCVALTFSRNSSAQSGNRNCRWDSGFCNRHGSRHANGGQVSHSGAKHASHATATPRDWQNRTNPNGCQPLRIGVRGGPTAILP